MKNNKAILALAACWAAGAFATSHLGSVVNSWDATYSYPNGGKAPLGHCYGDGYMYVMYDEIFAKRRLQDGKILDVVGLPVPGPAEVAYDPGRRRIWCACRDAGVYLLHPETGSYVASFPLPSEVPYAGAICYDRNTPSAPLWVTTTITWRLWNLTTAGSFVRSVPVTIMGKQGLAFDNDTAGGPYLFLAAWTDKPQIFACDPAAGSILYSFDAPVKGTQLHGLTWDGRYLWTNDSSNGYVVQFVAHLTTFIVPASLGRIRALYR